MSKAKYTKLGVIRTSADPKVAKEKGAYIALGDGNDNTDPKFVRVVEITVKDGNGNVLTKTKNGFLSMFDPRTNPNRSEEQKENIPDWLKKEIFLIEN